MGFEFYWPWMVLLLGLPLLVQWLWPRRNPEQAELTGRHDTLLHPALDQLQEGGRIDA